jgi:hypothetical protein
MWIVGSFSFREDPQGLSILNTGIPAYSARISPEQLRHRQIAIAEKTRYAPYPLEVSWFGPRPTNERELIDELWLAVDEFCQRRTGTPDDHAACTVIGNRSATAPSVLDEQSSRLSMSHSVPSA